MDSVSGSLRRLVFDRAESRCEYCLWNEHFILADGGIEPLSAEARVTVAILRLNDADRIAERRALVAAGLY